MNESKSKTAAKDSTGPVEDIKATELVDETKVVRSEDVEQEECFTF